MLSTKTKQISINGIGIALFVVLSLCLQVPVFENYYLCLGYIVMAVYCYSIGIFSGTLISTLGVVLYCFLINGLRGMPGWALGNIAIGLIVGIGFQFSKKIKNEFISTIVCILSIIIATGIGILGIKSLVECFLYAQPFLIRTANNIYAFIADITVLILSLPICKFLNNKIKSV